MADPIAQQSALGAVVNKRTGYRSDSCANKSRGDDVFTKRDVLPVFMLMLTPKNARHPRVDASGGRAA